ncbi:ABC transporter ATP-binding protein [Tenacibaculum sp. SZ-18]|uniref:ATP-binding cassette domain-containing protein n=1 Tax=Tenacibaculum sp. SZ-18 TaxID=754423 RepID=UPI000C2D4C76|nr:ABC transporter ATP-binding protein [Tenacibaculum sp. SZ-18]AUC14234.1 ABC transporter ATP-binding protein [Tenacibaculum sp. SZ-18]
MIRARKLSMSYNDKLALKDLNFAVAPGEIFCLLGQNVEGKKTTINVFLNVTETTYSEALNDSKEATKNHSTKTISYAPEIIKLNSNLSGVENLDFFSRVAGFNYSENELFQYLKKVNLREKAFKKKISAYSKCMRQKIGIALALAKKASYILMDEPTCDLDPKTYLEFTKTCKKLSEYGVGILMASHDIFNAVNICTRIGTRKKGTLVHIAETRNISARQLKELYIKTI